MKLALLIGNRFNPWHFLGYGLLRGKPDITVFRATTEIQKYFDERNDLDLGFAFETIHFEAPSSKRNPLRAVTRRLSGASPKVLPFHDRLRGFDLIQSWELFTDWSEEALLARERYQIPLALMVWDNIPFNMETKPGRRERKQRLLRGADRFIVHTERSRRMLLIEGAPEDRIALIPPGVDTRRFSPGPGDRATFGIEEDAFTILFVGWFLPRKGLPVLLMALRELIDSRALGNRPVRLLIAGSGPGKAQVDALIERLGLGNACRFLGSVPYGRMPEVYRAADLFVFPSIATPEWQEQFGMALLEAMACGVPAVSTYSGAIPEIAGEAVELCQPNDFLSLAETMHALISDSARRDALGASGRARVLERYTLEAFADALGGAYPSTAG